MDQLKHAYFLSKYRLLPVEDLAEASGGTTELAEEAELALRQVVEERSLDLAAYANTPQPSVQEASRRVHRADATQSRLWLLGYAIPAIGLLLPTIARLTSKADPIDAILFYLVGIIVWGTVAAGVILAWTRIKSTKNDLSQMSNSEINLACPVCAKTFKFGPHQYDGKHISAYQLTVCSSCYSNNHDGWAPHLEKVVTAVLVAKDESLPLRSKNGLLPRN